MITITLDQYHIVKGYLEALKGQSHPLTHLIMIKEQDLVQHKAQRNYTMTAKVGVKYASKDINW